MFPLISDQNLNFIPSWFIDFDDLDDHTKRISILALSYFSTMLLFGYCLKRFIESKDTSRVNYSVEPTRKIDIISRVFLEAGPKIQSINLDFLSLREVPQNISHAINLASISLSKNAIDNLPDDFASLKHLEVLNLSFNRFSKFPTVILSMTQLKWLNLDANSLKDIDDNIGHMTGLRELSLRHNIIDHLPDSFSVLLSLQKLHVSDNLFRMYPGSIKELTSLVSLNLDCNAISTIHENLISPYIHYLSLNSNFIKNMDTGFEICSGLTYLNLSCNRLERILDNLSIFSSLTYLDLHRNDLTVIPVSIASLEDLYFFDVSFNARLISLPISMGALTNLREFGFDNTLIPTDQFLAILQSIIRNKQGREEAFEDKIKLWSQFCSSTEPIDLHKLTNFERGCIYEWLKRLEITKDFSANQHELCSLVIEMLGKLNSNSFKEQFFNQLSSNLSDCEDRSLMNLILLNLLFRTHHFQGSLKEDLDLLIAAAKSLYLPTAVSESLLDGKSTAENTEVFLFVFTTLSKKLGLLLPYCNMQMHYKEFAIKCIGRGENPDLSIIEQSVLKKSLNDLIVDILPDAAEKLLAKHFLDFFQEIQDRRLEDYEVLEEKKEAMTSLDYSQKVEALNKNYFQSMKDIIAKVLS